MSFYQDHGCCQFCYFVGVETPEDEIHCSCAHESSKTETHAAHVWAWELTKPVEPCYVNSGHTEIGGLESIPF